MTDSTRPPSLASLAIAAIVLGLAIAILGCICSHADASPCGEERSAVKLGLDPDASSVNTRPDDTTIADLVSIKRPAHIPADRRADTTERTVFRVHGTITAYKLETDGDYHIVIADDAGHHMIVEVPASECARDGAWAEQIAAARAEAAARLRPDKRLRRVAMPVTVTGVGFFDVLHGQVGVAPTGIELHPVLAIEMGGGQ